MTLGELSELLNTDSSNAYLEVKVWLPGSTISLASNKGTLIRRGDVLMIEGNVDKGSALDSVINDDDMLRRERTILRDTVDGLIGIIDELIACVDQDQHPAIVRAKETTAKMKDAMAQRRQAAP